MKKIKMLRCVKLFFIKRRINKEIRELSYEILDTKQAVMTTLYISDAALSEHLWRIYRKVEYTNTQRIILLRHRLNKLSQ